MFAHINTKIGFVINQIYETLTSSELNTLTQLCELERTQYLTKLAIALTNPYTTAYLLTAATVVILCMLRILFWLYECKKHI